MYMKHLFSKPLNQLIIYCYTSYLPGAYTNAGILLLHTSLGTGSSCLESMLWIQTAYATGIIISEKRYTFKHLYFILLNDFKFSKHFSSVFLCSFHAVMRLRKQTHIYKVLLNNFILSKQTVFIIHYIFFLLMSIPNPHATYNKGN